jgi:hypothetical protein
MSGDRRDDRPADDEGEGFLSRWSQRKAMAREGVELPDEPELPEQPPVVDGAGVDNPPAEVEPENTEAPVELPPLESLDENSDYSAFLNKDVSPDLRQKALRKLFQSPKFNVRDGLDDYDLDFSNPEPLGNIVTAEMRYRIKAELERLARKALEEDASDETAVAAVAADGHVETEAPDNNEEIAEDDDLDENDEQPLTS